MSSGGYGKQLTEKFWLGSVIRLGGAEGSVASFIAGDHGSNPSEGENIFLN